MTDTELIRAIFDELQATAEAEQPALRQRIVRALRGEVATRPDQSEECQCEGALMVQTNLPEPIRKRIEEGGEMLRRRVEDETRQRIERWEALRAKVAEVVPPDLHQWIQPLTEQPFRHPDFWAELRLPGCAPIIWRFTFCRGEWHHIQWDDGLFAILPYEACLIQFAVFESNLDCAVAKAYEVGLHVVPANDEIPTEISRKGVVRRILDWLSVRCA